ncbi:MAG: hypothetical protein Q4P78_08610, partial [Rothia sp. (in: high G+C Gram-positive bacteria)]|uniref:hypothetical protein n=1 Tax=Rothia sp. (in: high G+C Gram-positive bacteria) TaxID=1885016 RepID=UPI002701F189|nr:hypothetical protein [Rothia sp. (in: high G+C Gram-positive bacteria)]
MKVVFKEEALEELYETRKTKDSKYKKLCRNKKLVDGYVRAVETMLAVKNVEKLREHSYLHYERLRHQGAE